MNKKTFFVGNLSFKAGEEDLKKIFLQFGPTKVRFGTDRMAGKPKGFAFVEVITEVSGADISKTLGSVTMDGRILKIEEESGDKPAREYRGPRERRIL